jgi:hypothetical protein
MLNKISPHLILSGLLLCLFFAESEARAAKRNYWLGLSTAKFVEDPFNEEHVIGAGVSTNYEVKVSERSSFGIHLAYRHFDGLRALSQMGYGLTILHRLNWLHTPWLTNAISYGLLMQVLRRDGVEGAGTSHDTRFAWHGILTQKQDWFVELSYHYSRLRYFEIDTAKVDYLEFTAGRILM